MEKIRSNTRSIFAVYPRRLMDKIYKTRPKIEKMVKNPISVLSVIATMSHMFDFISYISYL